MASSQEIQSKVRAKTRFLAVGLLVLFVLFAAGVELTYPALACADQSDLQPNQVRVYQDFQPAPDGIPDARYDMSYEVVYVSGASEDAPMPAGSVGHTFVWTMRGSTNYVLTFEVDSDTADGIYTYTMRPRGNEPDGFTMDERTEFTLTVDVHDGIARLRTPIGNGAKVGDPGWSLQQAQVPSVLEEDQSTPTAMIAGAIQSMGSLSTKTSDSLTIYLLYGIAAVGILSLIWIFVALFRRKSNKENQEVQK